MISMADALALLQALRASIEQLETARPDDPGSPFLGEVVLSRAEVLAVVDAFAGRATTATTREVSPADAVAAVQAALDRRAREVAMNTAASAVKE